MIKPLDLRRIRYESPIGDYQIDKSGIYFYSEKIPLPDEVDEVAYVHLYFNGRYVGLIDLRNGGTLFCNMLHCSYKKSDTIKNGIELHLNGIELHLYKDSYDGKS